jgi:adenylosuccinate synthase
MMFHRRGVHVIVDGQYGSTGKGAFAAYAARKGGMNLDVVVANAGPNSGHTFYGPNDEKVVLKQLPTLAVATQMFHQRSVPIFLSAGAAIDPDILNKEASEYAGLVFLSRWAALIRPEDKDAEKRGSVGAVAGTRQGVGIAIARKILREPDAVVGAYKGPWAGNIRLIQDTPNWADVRVGVEVSQGFSLGLNSHFYPKVTSRECTVMQGLADARIPAQRVTSVGMTIRTFPIRVGNVDGHSSGDYYQDQEETSWEELNLKPELTTVTQRIRRVFTFSKMQYADALLTNMPSTVCINFMDYLKTDEAKYKFAYEMQEFTYEVLKYRPEMLYGNGPYTTDISDDPAGGTNE